MKNGVHLLSMSNGAEAVTFLPEAILSNDFTQLLAVLIGDIQASSQDAFLTARIVVPDGSILAWLSHELSKKGISLLRLDIVRLEDALEGMAFGPHPLTRFHLVPLLTSFFATLPPPSELAPSSQKIVSSHYRHARKLRLPFALRAFLGEKAWFSKDGASELLWQKFEEWCASQITAANDCLSPPPSVLPPLFLFGFSSLNRPLLDRFLSLPSLKRMYLLSPCMLFWGDQASDREKRMLLASADTSHVARPSVLHLEQLLDSRQRLLSNSGQVGREFMLLIEDSCLQTRSMYVLPLAIAHPPYTDFFLPELCLRHDIYPTLLEYLKADLLFLIDKRESSSEPENRNCSFAENSLIDSESTMGFSLEEKADTSACLGMTLQNISDDMSIQIHGAPTPLREVEALRQRLSAFDSLSPASVIVLVTDLPRYTAAIEQVFGDEIPYQIWGKTSQSGAFSAFRMVTNLLMTKGTLNDWQQLLRHPLFHATLQITKDEAEALIEWLAKRSIRWGLSPDHRKAYLASRAIHQSSTAVSTSFSEERERLLDTFSGLSDEKPEVSLLRAIGNFFQFLSSMEGWWQLPLQPSTYATMDAFATLFDTIVQALLPKGFLECEGEALLKAMASFARISSETLSPSLPVVEALELFSALVENHLSRQSLHLSAPMIVAEFGSFQPFPALLIAILGAHEGALPHHSEEQLLCRLDRMVPKIPNSNTFLDRYSFIEVLLTAHNLFLSYQSYAFETREKTEISPMVADLLTHLDANYLIDGALPSLRLLHSHSLSRPQRVAPLPSLPSPLYLQKPPPLHSLDLSYLRRAARSPLEIFYREQYAFSSQRTQDESIFIKPWEVRSQLSVDIGTQTPSHKHPVYQKAFSNAQTRLNILHITSLQRRDLHLLPTVTSPHVTSTAIFAPLIGTSTPFIGSWPALVEEGIILFSDQWHKELFIRWPECALRAFLSEQHNIPFCHQAIIVEEGRIIPLSSSPHTLNAWSEFAALVSTIPFPFSYDIVRLLISDPSEEALCVLISAQAENEKSQGPWSTFAASITPDICSLHFPQWRHYAVLLWSDFFALEAP